MKIYIVENGTMMDGWEWHYDDEYHASTFRKAVEYINWMTNKDNFLKQVNPIYWSVEIGCEFKYGITMVELDKEFGEINE